MLTVLIVTVRDAMLRGVTHCHEVRRRAGNVVGDGRAGAKRARKEVRVEGAIHAPCVSMLPGATQVLRGVT
jgi:hypothetical protein